MNSYDPDFGRGVPPTVVQALYYVNAALSEIFSCMRGTKNPFSVLCEVLSSIGFFPNSLISKKKELFLIFGRFCNL